MGAPAIELNGVWFSYNGRPVLEDVNLTLEEGNFTAVIGPNGGGKTTLLKLISGLLKPDKGQVRVFGKPPGNNALSIGYVPQDTGANVSVPVTVNKVVLMGRIKGGWGFSRFDKKDRAAACHALEQVGMSEHKDRLIWELSGGQRQRVLVARAICCEPGILLLDEPTASMGHAMQTQLYCLLKELNQSATILVASHELMVLSSYIKSVACVNRDVHFHDKPEFSREMLETSHACPVDLIACRPPHRV